MDTETITTAKTISVDGDNVDIESLSDTCQLIFKEAQSRGISTQFIVPEKSLLQLTFKGKTVTCTDSLTDLTPVLSYTTCKDKRFTNLILKRSGLHVPDQAIATLTAANELFFKKYNRVVTKPLKGSMGIGVSVDIRSTLELKRAIKLLKATSDEDVLIEECVDGKYVRVLVFGYKYVAAVHHILPSITGDGVSTIERLIKLENRKKLKRSQIPLNLETERVVSLEGYTLQSILPAKETVFVRKNTNEHTGAIPLDVTDILSKKMIATAEEAARVLNIPTVGIDFLVSELDGDQYTIIEANASPALFGHGDQPIAVKFIDYLFPESKTL